MEEANKIDDELLLTIDGLGKYDSTSRKFIRGDDFKLCLRDLLKFVKQDNESNKFQYRRQMAHANVIGTVILPLLSDLGEDKDDFDVVLRLLTVLTNPVLLHFEEKLPDSKEANQLHISLTMNLYNYKLLFGSCKKAWSVVGKYLAKILEVGDEDRQIEDTMMLQRILVLIRNVLHIPLAPVLEKNTNDEANPQDNLIEMFIASSILESLQYMNNTDELSSQFCLYLIEIMSLLFRSQNPEFLAKSFKSLTEAGAAAGGGSGKKTEFERNVDKQELEELVRKDKAKIATQRFYRSRFKEATYQLKNVKGLGENDVLLHKAPTSLENVSISGKKQMKKKPKNLAALKDEVFTDNDTVSFHKSTRSVRLALGKFCNEFLNAYNNFMHNVRYKLSRNEAQENDQTYYLWAFQFFMEFNRHTKKNISLISETMTVEAFHYIHTLIQDYHDRLKMEKSKEFVVWSRRMHYGIKAYRELLYTIHFASASTKFSDYDLAKTIKGQVFYENDYREMVLLLLREFNEKKMSQAMLRDLIETNHIFLNMLQKFCLTNDIVVATKLKKKAKSRKQAGRRKKRAAKVSEETWEEVNSELNEALEGRTSLPTHEENEDVVPMDATVDFENEPQKTALMKRLRRLLLAKQPVAALALYRNAREAWSDDGEMTFGTAEITIEEERAALKEIYLAGFDCEADDGLEQNNENEEPNEGIVEEEVEKETVSVMFDFREFVGKFCSPKIIIPYYALFRRYERNTPVTNKCIIKMYHRIAVDCGLHGHFFQACLFRVFQRLLQEKDEAYAELRRFAKYIVSKFVDALKTNDKLLPELLFWKRSKEALSMDTGFEDVAVVSNVEGGEDGFVPQFDSDQDRLDDDDLNENVQSAKAALFGNDEESNNNERDNEDEALNKRKRRPKKSKAVLSSDDGSSSDEDRSEKLTAIEKVIENEVAGSELDVDGLNVEINSELGLQQGSEVEAQVVVERLEVTETISRTIENPLDDDDDDEDFNQDMRNVMADLFGQDGQDDNVANDDEEVAEENDIDQNSVDQDSANLGSSPVASHRKPRRQIIESDDED